MMRLDWGNPKITLGEFDSYMQTLLGDQFDGLVEENGYLYIYVFSPLSGDQENAILEYYYTLSAIPRNVSIVTQPAITIATTPPFGSKTMVIGGVTKNLFARFTGVQFAVVAGSNTLTYTATYPWVKILGVEVINSEPLDTADLKVLDTATGTYSGVPNRLLNQFAYTINLPKDYYIRMAQFDADLYYGMVIQITYTSVSAKTVGLNLLMNEVKA